MKWAEKFEWTAVVPGIQLKVFRTSSGYAFKYKVRHKDIWTHWLQPDLATEFPNADDAMAGAEAWLQVWREEQKRT